MAHSLDSTAPEKKVCVSFFFYHVPDRTSELLHLLAWGGILLSLSPVRFRVSDVKSYIKRPKLSSHRGQHTDIDCTALPLPGDSEERSDKLPPVGLGVHVHAEVHGSLQESRQGSHSLF